MIAARSRSPRSEPAGHEKDGESLFVYGTLKRGGPSHHLLAASRFLRNGVVAGRLYDTGTFPALVLGGPSVVHGEVWRCTRETLALLDSYEGVDEGLFVRLTLDLEDEKVWVYVAGPRLEQKLANYPLIAGGVWPRP